MRCEQIDERLLEGTAAEPRPAFDPAELEHLRECPRCRERAAAAEGVLARLGLAAATEAPPDPAYWTSIVPRLRRRMEVEPRGLAWIPNAIAPVAAAIVVVTIALTLSGSPDDPGVDAARTGTTGAISTLESLSEADLHELRLAGAATGILESAETNASADWTIAEFLSDLVSEEGDSILYAAAEPEELLANFDDARFAEIVSQLEHR